jgi:NAD(P) transhydrogenase subunit alpha
VVAGRVESSLSTVLAVVAVAFATINVVGGFLVTDRMLQMFRRKPEASQ